MVFKSEQKLSHYQIKSWLSQRNYIKSAYEN